ncbi:ATP-binding protein [Serinibacter arcticus]|uniref:ATP-binding protein n=1 Tax=Serinibacter arcticus TaxID=1655435 RepID=UPI001304AB1A|nr:ATP-binding protein [Serinibacter arcticus]
MAAARRRAADAFAEAGLGKEESQILVLLVSELVTNAIVHARPPVELSIDVDRWRTRVEVSDAVGRVPHARSADRGASGGRGLALVEQLSTQWGTTIGSRGKSVWLELARSADTARVPITAA